MFLREISRVRKLGKIASRSFSQLGLKGEELLNQPNLNKDYDTVIVGYTDLYGRLLGKRYEIDYFLNSGIKQSKACTYTFALDMPMNPLEGFKFANWSSGFGDFVLIPDLNSFRVAAWLPKTLIILCDVHDSNSGDLVPIAPRSLLKNSIKKLEDTVGQPVTVKAATELEYYLFNTSFEEAARQNYAINPFNSFASGLPKSGVELAGFYSEDYHILQSTRNEDFTSVARNKLKESGIVVETSKGETGIGQHELNVSYNEALAMADDHVIYKQCLKEIAIQQGKSITFMAKPLHYDAGSSCHVHLSIHDKHSGRNLFYREANEPSSTSNSAFKVDGELKEASLMFQHFLGGWIKNLNDFFVLYCPTVNSYKRLQKGSWAPTAGAYGVDNRTAGFRIIKDYKKGKTNGAMRVECRLPGADVNPYLTLAASILSGAKGIGEKQCPGEMLRGDGYTTRVEGSATLPSTLKEATASFGESSVVRELLGEEIQEHYARFYSKENEAFESTVTDWERKRYFEQI